MTDPEPRPEQEAFLKMYYETEFGRAWSLSPVVRYRMHQIMEMCRELRDENKKLKTENERLRRYADDRTDEELL